MGRIFNDAFLTYYSELVVYAKRHFDESTAEDLVQQAFVSLLRFQGEIHHTRGFLYHSLVDLISLEHRRTARRAKPCRQQRQQRKQVDETPYDVAAHLDRVRRVRQAMRKMKPHLRAVALDVLLEGYTRGEAAERHNVSLDVVKWAIKLARKHIKKALAAEVAIA